jgi:hypothetical protein
MVPVVVYLAVKAGMVEVVVMGMVVLFQGVRVVMAVLLVFRVDRAAGPEGKQVLVVAVAVVVLAVLVLAQIQVILTYMLALMKSG